MLQINASIAKHKNRIWCSYQTKHLRHYNAEYFLTELNTELVPISEKRLIAQNNNTAFEGVRLFSFDQQLFAFYQYLPFIDNIGWQCNYGVGYGEIDTESGVIKNQISLRTLSKRKHEKNWSPYTWDNELYMITDFDPFLRIIKIGRPDLKQIPTEIFFSTNQTKRWQHGELMGGTPLISPPGENFGWLYGFVHSFCVDSHGFDRYYNYTAVRFHHEFKRFEYHDSPITYQDDEPDEEYETLWKRSNGKHRKVIFPIGIMLHDDGVIVSFGKDDVLSYTEHYSWERIKSYFK